MERNNKKTRFNIIDAFVILLILLFIAAIVLYILASTGRIEVGKKHNEIIYTMRIICVDEELTDRISVGETAYDSSTFAEIGKIVAIDKEKSIFYGSDAVAADGGYAIRATEYEDKYDIYITIETVAETDPRGIIYIAGKRACVGTQMYFRSGGFASEAYITSFTIGAAVDIEPEASLPAKKRTV